MNPNDDVDPVTFPLSSQMVLCEMSWQLLDGFPLVLVHTYNIGLGPQAQL